VELYREQKLNHLISLGFQIEDSTDDTVEFDYDGYQCIIDFAEFDIDDTATKIFNRADIYSCCEDILDRDIMMCPTCHEHC
jgi:hypothetical protein